MTTEAKWCVKPLAKVAKAKNMIFFVGDGSEYYFSVWDRSVRRGEA
jgi:hypothetical protein